MQWRFRHCIPLLKKPTVASPIVNGITQVTVAYSCIAEIVFHCAKGVTVFNGSHER
jgi:hypothetical protein